MLLYPIIPMEEGRWLTHRPIYKRRKYDTRPNYSMSIAFLVLLHQCVNTNFSRLSLPYIPTFMHKKALKIKAFLHLPIVLKPNFPQITP